MPRWRAPSIRYGRSRSSTAATDGWVPSNRAAACAAATATATATRTAGDALGMRVGHLRRLDRLLGNGGRPVRVVRPERRYPQRGAIAAWALTAERCGGCLPPRHAISDLVQDHHGAGTVAADRPRLRRRARRRRPPSWKRFAWTRRPRRRHRPRTDRPQSAAPGHYDHRRPPNAPSITRRRLTHPPPSRNPAVASRELVWRIAERRGRRTGQPAGTAPMRPRRSLRGAGRRHSRLASFAPCWCATAWFGPPSTAAALVIYVLVAGSERRWW
jgi:hypothetical protein